MLLKVGKQSKISIPLPVNSHIPDASYENLKELMLVKHILSYIMYQDITPDVANIVTDVVLSFPPGSFQASSM